MNRLLPLLLALVLGVAGCTREQSVPATNSEQVSTDWTLLVRDAHALADDAKSSSRRTAAIVALNKALEGAPAASNARVAWVLQDLHFRLAQVLTDDSKLEQAHEVIAKGLTLASEPTVARANLFALQGKVYELQAKPEQASRALHDALLINEVLLERALEGEVEPERK